MSYITSPEGMSHINALKALWDSSKTATFFDANHHAITMLKVLQESQMATAAKVASLFEISMSSSYPGVFDYVASRAIKSDFSLYPKIEISGYDKIYGTGAAARALENYNKIPSKNRLDAGDCYQWLK